MTREIDRDGNMLVHIEKFTSRTGNVVVKKFADYTDACNWRRKFLDVSKMSEEDWQHAVDSEWVKKEEEEREEIDWDGEDEFAAEYTLMCEEID